MIGSIVLLVVVGLVGALLLAPTFTPKPTETANTTENTPQQEAPTNQPDNDSVESAPLVAGRYTTYDSSRASEAGFDTTVVFFHASWCPECRAFDEALANSTIPDGVQVLKVDYDSSTDLRQKYGVTIQSTFVSIDPSGNEVSKWVGYGKEKTIDAVLSNI